MNINLSVYKQVEHYKETVAELRSELECQKRRVNWHINETSALESKLYAFRQSASYDRMKSLEGLKEFYKNENERRGKLLVWFQIYSVVSTITLIVLVSWLISTKL